MRHYLLFPFIVSFIYVQHSLAQKTAQEKIAQYMISCDPCINAYEYVGFVGSGEFGGYEYDNGKIVSVPTKKSSTPSNGWYNFWVSIKSHRVFYCDSVIKKLCISSKYGSLIKDGYPASTFKHEKQEVKTDTTRTLYSLDFQAIDDSIFINNQRGDYYRKYTLTKEKFVIETPEKNDLWNIYIELEEHGFPTYIYSAPRKTNKRFRYTKFDNYGNWIERETINSNGSVSETISRTITYKEENEAVQDETSKPIICKYCDGKGKVTTCPECHGSGWNLRTADYWKYKCRYCGGSKTGIFVCPKCKGKT